MKPTDFYDAVTADETMTASYDEEREFVRVWGVGGQGVGLPMHVVETETWPHLKNHIDQGMILVHASRIVGYLSYHHNWSDSKLGELADRRLGQYTIDPNDEFLQPDAPELAEVA